ncbi:uncharacterized protein ACWYII_045478 [Salvelinus alpinus]
MELYIPISWGYGNDTVWEEYIDISFTVANCAVLLFTSFVGIAANVFVTWAVYRQKSLRTWNNALLVNLAVIDILRCCIDCPILFTIVLKGPVGGGLEELLCDTQVASFSFSCCIQLLTLACISMERHQAITHPFKITQRRRRILVWIPLTWMVGVLVAAFCLTFVKDSPVYVRCRGWEVNVQLSYDTFGLYILLPLWSTCFTVIIGFYAHIFIIVRAHGRKIFDKGSFSAPKQDIMTEAKNKVQGEDDKDGKTKHEESEKTEIEEKRETDQKENRQGETVQQEHALPVEKQLSRKDPEIGFTNTTTKNPQGAMKGSSDNMIENKTLGSISKLLATEVKLPCVSFMPQVDNPSSKVLKLVDLEQDKDVRSLHPNSNSDRDVKADDISPLPTKVEETVAAIPVPETPAAKQCLEVEGGVCMMPSFANKEHAKKKKESKLAKRSGYIILTFLIFWMPLIVMMLANVFCNRNRNFRMGTAQNLEILSVSVACMTSASNPITYAVVNPQFRTEFYYLRRKCKSLWTRA